MRPHRFAPALVLLLSACPGSDESGDTDTDSVAAFDGYIVGSIVITDSGRTMYVQAVTELGGTLNNDEALEVPGNAILDVAGNDVFAGLVEEPTWVRYSVGEDGSLSESGRISFAAYGWTAIDYANTFVDADTALSYNTSLGQAIVWDPSTLTITGTVDLPHMLVEDYGTEAFKTTSHDGLVYIPGKFINWTQGTALHQVMITVVDPDALSVKQVISDERCPISGRMLFGPDGTGYVMSDGRNYSVQMFARAAGATAEEAPRNCFLRLEPGADGFDEAWKVDVVDLTDGREVLTEMEWAENGTGIGFSKVFYEERLPEGVEPTSFAFWGENIGRMWRFDLTQDPPAAAPVEGLPYSGIGFGGTAVDGTLLVGETTDAGATSQVFAIDPQTNVASEIMTMDGYFYGAYPLGR